MLPQRPAESTTHVFKSSYEYSVNPNTFHNFNGQPNTHFRESSNNRNSNSSLSSSMILRQKSSLQNCETKLKRDGSFKGSLDYKENNPNVKNFMVNSAYVANPPLIKKDSIDYSSDYQPNGKNLYSNPNMSKKMSEKSLHPRNYSERNSFGNGNGDDTPKKALPPKATEVTKSQFSEGVKQANTVVNQEHTQASQTLKASKGQGHGHGQGQESSLPLSQIVYEMKSRISELEREVKQHTSEFSLHSSKLVFLQEQIKKPCHHQQGSSPRTNEEPPSPKNRKHSRSISTNSSSPANFKELSDIMSLIEETKSYQKKNSDEYRKMIEEFRKTILEFRDELNCTVKKEDLSLEIARISDSLHSSNFESQREEKQQQQQRLLGSVNEKQFESQMETLSMEINQLKSQISKINENQLCIKADIVKMNLKEKQNCDKSNEKYEALRTKLELVEERAQFNFDTCKKGHKYYGEPIVFKVSNSLLFSLKNSQAATFSEAVKDRPFCENLQNENQSQPLTVNQLTIEQKTYRIDPDGYLMDENNLYLLNDRDEQIRLSDRQMSVLKKKGVLK